MKRFALIAFALTIAGCADTVTGSPTMSPIPTNKAGRVHITFDPCKAIPASVIQQLQLDKKPGRPYTQTDGDIENVFCGYRSRNEYYLSVAASNYTLEMLKKTANHWGFQEFELNGRRALGSYTSAQPKTDACAIDVAATTGVYSVVLGTVHNDFTPYPDCMTAARTNLEALLPYFPY